MKKLVCILLAVMLFAGSVLPAWAEGLESPVVPPHTHEGGEATCTEQAICDICGEPYGELDPANHEWGEWTDVEKQGEQMLQKRICEWNGEHVESRYVPLKSVEPADWLPYGTIIHHTNGRTYRVLENGAVWLVSVSKKDKVKNIIKVASYITVDGKKYTITRIAAGAFTGCKNLQKVSIASSTIKTISTDAFDGLSMKQIKKIKVYIKKTNPYFKTLKKRLVMAGVKNKNVK